MNALSLSTSSDAPPHHLPETLIEGGDRKQGLNLGELWNARELVILLAWRDIQVRYKQTVLGAAWAILQPLLMMVVFTIFFGRLAGLSEGPLPYSLFTLTGLLPWMMFATTVTAASNSVVGSERLITKVYFPRLAIPLASAGPAIVDFLVGISLVFVMGLYHGFVFGRATALPAWTAPLCLGLLAVELALAMGIGLWLATLNVMYRDARYVVPFLLQIWMFSTPTLYMQKPPDSGLPYLFWLANPMTPLLQGFRGLLFGLPIAKKELILATLVSGLVFASGVWFFRRFERQFADVI
ncbi:ABC-2 type transporter [Isosphaera pallida ATCC 43644]|uniref:Transport permease protein n=1 Tax=Isosphaera pallida (strain ATCC 43644 / DSM 9630 / IS1B) TaxID=575540 RepID=E8R3W1_ISOPI|nr:ABC transporter permease [Isosphaera pallida]ADV63691.1 ABC-2 type transporter [Isosphaera pallida ATCC 43644]